MSQHSILRFAQIHDMTELIASIESVTAGKIVKINQMFGQAYLTIEHQSGSTCPHCGEPIHLYGHGLCLKCWTVKKDELRGF